MPAGGDEANAKRAERAEKAAERKRQEAERKKKQAEQAAPPLTVVTSIGKVNPSSPRTESPSRTICEAARDARARNSPAAPNLEAQCRAAP